MGHEGDDGESGPRHGMFVWTAYRAWNELLQEKLKKKFEAQEGPWMDKLAGELVQLVDARWEGGRKGDQLEHDVLQRIDKLLQE
jgi:hypothetical protein